MTATRFLSLFRPAFLTLAFVLLLDLAGVAAGAEAERGVVRGCVERSEEHNCRGVASLWPAVEGKGPDPRRAIRPPLVSAPLGTDGCFDLQAKPGDYFVGAVVRKTAGGWQGPPRPGDLVFLSPDPAGGTLKVTVSAGESIDIGRHASGWRYEGFLAGTSALTLSGTLLDVDGQPMPGLLVFAFTDSAMSGEPLAVSEPSDSRGRYLLRLPETATVYLRAREHYGRRSPLAGGYMGIYGEGGNPVPVTVGDTVDKADRNLTILLIPALEQRQGARSAAAPPLGGK